MLEKKQRLFGYDIWKSPLSKAKMKPRFMTENVMPLSDATKGYELFNEMKVQKGEASSSHVEIGRLSNSKAVIFRT